MVYVRVEFIEFSDTCKLIVCRYPGILFFISLLHVFYSQTEDCDISFRLVCEDFGEKKSICKENLRSLGSCFVPAIVRHSVFIMTVFWDYLNASAFAS